ncbi:MAG TPA: hypothetical protein VFP84_11965 [Kofleriaceae bacterium]|nr:hypothetical protein [Kofleriaceae bacterium]
MRLQSRIYITTQGCQDELTTRALMDQATALLDELYDRGKLTGYKSHVLTSADDYAEQDLERDLIVADTGGKLPALYLNLTLSLDAGPPDVEVFAPVLAQFGFHHLLTESDP